MGLDFKTAEFLLSEAERKVSFQRLLVLGRQNVTMTPFEIAKVKELTGVTLRPSGFADEFFRALGATDLSFLDRSEYEGADVLHDLNQPLPPQYHARFDTVIDGGTLEHIFNLPVALRSCMEALALGGRLMSFTPADGLMGHGFFQFSPELFFRACGSANGFEVERMLISYLRRWYEVRDPAQVGHRVEASIGGPAILCVTTRRCEIKPIFGEWPIQSDYAGLRSGIEAEVNPKLSLKDRLVTRVKVLSELQSRWRIYKGHRACRLSNTSSFRGLGGTLLSR
ncbi:MAG: class I SAM-dependent methyltransferase [Verrucomicrobia bacterium]|nr:class I SAM-dependent methyltransferase [Verrucomicrobiota bacterium]